MDGNSIPNKQLGLGGKRDYPIMILMRVSDLDRFGDRSQFHSID